MLEVLFSGPVDISIQGHRALRLKKRHSEYAEYTVLGFGDQVLIYDFRENGLEAIDHVLATNNTTQFPNKFNGPAHLTMFDLTDNEPMLIELRNSIQTGTHLLWIAIGLEGQIPIYKYDVGLVQQMDDSRIALLLLLDIELNGLHFCPYDSSSNPSIISKPIPPRFSFEVL